MPVRTSILSLSLLSLFAATGCPGEGGLPVDDDDSAVTAGDDDDSTEAVTPTSPVPVTLTTPDNKSLRATWQAAPGVSSGGAVLMLHELGGNRQDFNLTWDAFQEQGISTFAFDFRGHGGSDPADINLAELRTTPDQLEIDVRTALDWMGTQAVVDPLKVGIIGLDVGANLAIVGRHASRNGAPDSWGVRSVVAITPDIAGIEALGALDAGDLVLSSVQYVAGENAAQDAADATALYDLTGEPRDIRIVLQTSSHGADMLSGSSDARAGVAAWFAARFDE